MSATSRQKASKWLALATGALLTASLIGFVVQVARRPRTLAPKVIIGTKDEVYYARHATMQEATALGHALEGTGFFNGRGTSVQLARINGIPVISFVLNDGAWNHPATVASFEEIGRRVASSVGGFPIQVKLVNSEWTQQKSLTVGKTVIGARDVVYYFGNATQSDAENLGKALREAGYLADLGVSVAIWKDGGVAIGFVVGEGVWERGDAVAGFERLARRVAPAVGGLPLTLRLLSPEMEIKKEVEIR